MLKHPFSITLFGDWMYWTDWDRNAIFQADKFTGKSASLVANSSMVNVFDPIDLFLGLLTNNDDLADPHGHSCLPSVSATGCS
jgi:hypothetical protein